MALQTLESLLIATDFSPEARHAAQRGARLAKEAGAARVALMHVLGPAPDGFEERVAAQAQSALAELAAELGSVAGVEVEQRLARGSAVDRLAEAGSGFGLVVAGARGEDPLFDLALGRTSERLVRRSTRPVLLVKSAPRGPYSRVVAAVDFSPASRAGALLAAAFAPGAPLELAHAFESEFESTLRFAGVADEQVALYRQQARARAMSDMERFIVEAGLPAARLTRTIVHGYAPRVVARAAADAGADLVAVGRHRPSRLEALILRSVSLEVVERAQCDVLVVPAP
jgi:nucleotide-binding universal stress UspA family protein